MTSKAGPDPTPGRPGVFPDGWNVGQQFTMRESAESDIDRLESVEVRFRHPNDVDSPKSIFKVTDLSHSVSAMDSVE